MAMSFLSLLCFISSIRVEINRNYLQKILFLYFLRFSDSLKIPKKQNFTSGYKDAIIMVTGTTKFPGS